ncbi:MAG TPA: DUF370 domain-containing protein [Spirochaetota bacterium]|nr:DUF370 domain-containing protein [Spirochaetota bacterium]HPJ37848.1 DUF370 domain-containing protein [Spirochaetota bacterium]HPQ51862.1 DUF370 domain-containing protein [Spirochaetota bacterium]
MFIHIGNRITISDTRLVGIFNVETLKFSEDNIFYYSKSGNDDKTVVIDIDNNVYTSGVSSFTLIKRNILKEGIIWSRNHGERI